MRDQLAQFLIGNRRLANLAIEIDVTEHAFERRVLVFECAEGFVQTIADILM